MSATDLAGTALLLGLLVLAAGAYAGLYSLGRLCSRPGWVRYARLCYVLALACAAAIGLATPLLYGWKLLVAGSVLAYAAIPPLTWHYLQRLHAEQEQEQ